MAELNFQFQNSGRIPADVKETLGSVTVLKVLEPRQEFEDDKPTGEIIERQIEAFSTKAEGAILLALDPNLSTEGLKFGDELEFNDSDISLVAWSNISPNAQNAFADTGVKIKVHGFRKAGGVPIKPAERKPEQVK